MSKPKSNTAFIGVSLLIVSFLFFWIFGTRHDAISASEFHARFVPDASFNGDILVKIIERYTGPERSLGFLIDLDLGEISTTTSGQPSEVASGAGGNLVARDCAQRFEFGAPDHELSAYCAIQGDGFVVGIRDLRSSTLIRERSVGRGWAIGGLAWSANSKAIAVLIDKGRTDFSPIGLLSAASGHPIPLYSFKVVLFSNQLDHQIELPMIRKDSPSGWARIDWIQ